MEPYGDIELHKRRVAYSNTLKMALQQQDSRIWEACDLHDVDAEDGLSFDGLGITNFQEVTGKAQPTPNMGGDFERRWLSTRAYNWGRLYDKFDKTAVLTDPGSPDIRSAVMAANRLKDQVCLNAMFANVKTGREMPGDGADIAFPTRQVIGVGAGTQGYVRATASGGTATGISRAKLNMGAGLFKRNEAPENEVIHVAISADEFETLLDDEKLTNRDFLLGQFNEKGMVGYLGWTFIHTEQIPLDSSGYRRVPMWQKSGLRRGVAQDLMTKLDERSDLSYALQAYADMKVGAARAEEGQVVEIKCLPLS